MPSNSTTPRILVATVKMDVTKGPKLKRGVTTEHLLLRLAHPLAVEAERLASNNFGVESQKTTFGFSWGYTYMSDEMVMDGPLWAP